MKISLKRLNNSGVAHHFLIAIIAVVIVAGFGAYKVFFSKAATAYTVRSSVVKVATSEGCWLAGRTWSNNDCTNNCRDAGDIYKTKKGSDGTTRGYCVNAVAVAVSPVDCKNYQRRYVYEIGCARKVTDKDALGATQCIYSNHTYFSTLSPDVCKLVCPAGYTISSNTCVAPKPAPTTTTTTSAASTPSGSTATTTNASSGAGPTCVNDTTGSGTNLSAGQTCPAGTHSLCANNAAPVNGTCPESAINSSIPGVNPIKICPNNGAIQANGLCPGGVQPTIQCPSGLVNGNDGKCYATVGSNNTQKCPDGSKPNAQGDCKQEIIVPAAPAVNIVSVDATMNKKDCLLLGREWIGKANSAGQQKGCSMESCNKQKDSLILNSGKPFCKSAKFDRAYAVRLSKKDCNELHRQWIDQVSLCAQVPNQERKNKEVVNADQCVGAFSTYYIRPGKNDECFKPDFFNRAQSVAKKVGSPLGGVLKVGPAAYCNAKSGWHWDGTAKECKRDRKIATTSDAPTGSLPAANSTVNKDFCENKLHRTYNGNGGCNRVCVSGYGNLTNLSGNQWDYCSSSQGQLITGNIERQDRMSCSEFKREFARVNTCAPYTVDGTEYCKHSTGEWTDPPSKQYDYTEHVSTKESIHHYTLACS